MFQIHIAYKFQNLNVVHIYFYNHKCCRHTHNHSKKTISSLCSHPKYYTERDLNTSTTKWKNDEKLIDKIVKTYNVVLVGKNTQVLESKRWREID